MLRAQLAIDWLLDHGKDDTAVEALRQCHGPELCQLIASDRDTSTQIKREIVAKYAFQPESAGYLRLPRKEKQESQSKTSQVRASIGMST
jgi:hypothetical protein